MRFIATVGRFFENAHSVAMDTRPMFVRRRSEGNEVALGRDFLW
jgi:hypothetical protein